MFQNKNISGIRENKLFADVDFSGIKIKTNPKDLMNIPEGEIIYRPGDDTNYIYLIITGEVKVKIPGGTNRATKVYKVGKLDFFGEKEVLENLPRNSSAVAEIACSIYPVKKNIITDYANKSKNLLSNLYRKNDPNAIDIITSTPAQESVNPDFLLNTESTGTVFNFGVKAKRLPVIEQEPDAEPKKEKKEEDLSESFFKRSVLPDSEVKAPPVSYPVAKPKVNNDIPPVETKGPPTPGFAALEKLDEIVNDEAHRGIIDFDVLDENTIITDDLLNKQTVEHKFTFSNFSPDEVAKNPFDDETEEVKTPQVEPEIPTAESTPPVFDAVKEPEPEEIAIPVETVPEKIPSADQDVITDSKDFYEDDSKTEASGDDFFIDYEAELNNSFILKNIPIDDLDIDNLKPVKFSFSEDDGKEGNDKVSPAPLSPRKTGEEIIKDDIIEPGMDFEAELLKQREERRKSKEMILESYGLLKKEEEKPKPIEGKDGVKKSAVSFDSDGMMILNADAISGADNKLPKDRELTEDELSSRRKKTYDFSSEGFELNDLNKFSPFDNGFIVPDPHPFDDETPAKVIEPPSKDYDFLNDEFDIQPDDLSEKVSQPSDFEGMDTGTDSFDITSPEDNSAQDFSIESEPENPFDYDVIKKPEDEKSIISPVADASENKLFEDEDFSDVFDIDDIDAEISKDKNLPGIANTVEIIPEETDTINPFTFTENAPEDFPLPVQDSFTEEIEESDFSSGLKETNNNDSKLFEEFVTDETEYKDTKNDQSEFEEFLDNEINPEPESGIETDDNHLFEDFKHPGELNQAYDDDENNNILDSSPETDLLEKDVEQETTGLNKEKLFDDFDSHDVLNDGTNTDDIEAAPFGFEKEQETKDNLTQDFKSIGELEEDSNTFPINQDAEKDKGSSLFFSLLGDNEPEATEPVEELKPFIFRDVELEDGNLFEPAELPEPLMGSNGILPLEEPLFEQDEPDELIKPLSYELSIPEIEEPLSNNEEVSQPEEPLFEQDEQNELTGTSTIEEPLFEDDNVFPEIKEPLFKESDALLTGEPQPGKEELSEPVEPLFENEELPPLAEPLFEAEDNIPDIKETIVNAEDLTQPTEPLFEPFDASQIRNNITKSLEEENHSLENNEDSFSPHNNQSGWDSINFTSGLGETENIRFPELNIPKTLLRNEPASEENASPLFEDAPIKSPEVESRVFESGNVTYSIPDEDKFLVNNLNSSFEYLLGSLHSIEDRLKDDEEATKLLSFFDGQAKVLQSNLDMYIDFLKHGITVETGLEEIKEFVDTSLIKIAGFYDSKGKKIFKKLNVNENLYIDKKKLFTAFFELIRFMFSLDNNIDNIYTALVKMGGNIILDIRIKEFIMAEEDLDNLKLKSNSYLMASDIINKHDSAIRISATEGKGTSIKIIFPIPIQ
ncbi:MAG: cyclic nucleotide-binding domain-containing protein [Bacteroidota bacterium]|nr:cyclic nucleotide-binding domain-containing protein [Bacteroidota bacterium]